MSRLYPCVYCTEGGYCKKYSDDEATSWCVLGPCKDEKPSNADRIRAMTDMELAKELSRIHGTCDWCPMHDDCDGENCDGQLLDWLKQETET